MEAVAFGSIKDFDDDRYVSTGSNAASVSAT